MRLLFGVLTCLALITPALSGEPDVPITCKMVDPDAAARLLDAPLGPPKFERIVVCTGICPSLNPAPNCTFDVANPPDSGRTTLLQIRLDLPPFQRGDWVRSERGAYHSDKQAIVEDLDWRGGVALWYFRPDQAHGFLEVLLGPRGDRAQLLVTLEGFRDNAQALRSARALAVNALARLRRATPDELSVWNLSK